MKRLWIGVILLALTLAAGLAVTEIMERSHLPSAQALKDASRLAMEDEWQGASEYAANARENWEKKWRVTASFADHEPMDEIDALFAELHVFAQARDPVAYSAVCAHLARLLEAMGKGHSFNWWNLL